MLFVMNLMIVPGMFVCSSFMICVCMFIVSKALLISDATVIVRAGGAIWLNPFAMVYFVLQMILPHHQTRLTKMSSENSQNFSSALTVI